MTWETDLQAVWEQHHELDPREFIEQVIAVINQPGIPQALREYEVARGHEGINRPDFAVDGYQRALDEGLDPDVAKQASAGLLRRQTILGRG